MRLEVLLIWYCSLGEGGLNIGSAICVQVVCLMKAVYKLGYKCKVMTPISMRPIRGETRHKIGQLSYRSVVQILPRSDLKE